MKIELASQCENLPVVSRLAGHRSMTEPARVPPVLE
jgi:hypothetical protein